jgi:hypothetical protein
LAGERVKKFTGVKKMRFGLTKREFHQREGIIDEQRAGLI